jgi:hypothetical protein
MNAVVLMPEISNLLRQRIFLQEALSSSSSGWERAINRTTLTVTVAPGAITGGAISGLDFIFVTPEPAALAQVAAGAVVLLGLRAFQMKRSR